MTDLKLKQFKHEIESWKRSLGFMMEENVYLKNRLSDLLKENFRTNLLEEAENYQTYFLNEDKLIGLLRNEIAELEKLLIRQAFENEKFEKEIEKKIKQLRKSITDIGTQFGKLKSKFNTYMSEQI